MATYVATQAVRNGSLIAVNKRRTDGEWVPYLKEASTGRYRLAVRDNQLTVDNPAINDLISIIEQIDLEPIGSDFGAVDFEILNQALDDFQGTIEGAFVGFNMYLMAALAIFCAGIIVTERACDIIKEAKEKEEEEEDGEGNKEKIIHYSTPLLRETIRKVFIKYINETLK